MVTLHCLGLFISPSLLGAAVTHEWSRRNIDLGWKLERPFISPFPRLEVRTRDSGVPVYLTVWYTSATTLL